jgi:hypothetical protein
VPRTIDAELNAWLRARSRRSGVHVLVVRGESAAGKTRALYDACRQVVPRAWLVAPRTLESVDSVLDARRLLALCSGQDPVIVWLDDLEQFVAPGPSGIAWQHLSRLGLMHRPVLALATMGGKGAGLIPDEQRRSLSAPMEALFRQAKPTFVAMTRELSADELGAVHMAFGWDAREAAREHGLGPYLIAGTRLMTKLQTRRSTPGSRPNPGGAKLIGLVVEWHRCGNVEGIPLAAAERLWTRLVASRTSWRRALAWARDPVIGDVALLELSDGRLAVHDYVLSRRRAEALAPVADRVWRAVLAEARGSEPALGATAIEDRSRFPRFEETLTRRALHAWDVAAEGGDAGSALDLGHELARLGRLPEARAAYERAVDLGVGEGALRLAAMARGTFFTHAAYRHASRARRIFGEQRDTVCELRAICVMAEIDPIVGGETLIEFLDELASERHDGGLHEALAETLWDHGRVEDAVSAFERALSDEWEDGRAFAYATALLEAGRLDDALEVAGTLRQVIYDESPLIELVTRIAALGHDLEARAVLGGDERLAARTIAWELYANGHVGPAESQLRWAAARGHAPAEAELALLLALTGRATEGARRLRSVPGDVVGELRQALDDEHPSGVSLLEATSQLPELDSVAYAA